MAPPWRTDEGGGASDAPPRLGSAYEHIKRRGAPPANGEAPDASLPDDAYQNARRGGGIGFAPGAVDGILGHARADPAEGARNARTLHGEILRLLRESDAEFEDGVTRLAVSIYATSTLPHLLPLLGKGLRTKSRDLLYSRMRGLLVSSGHREVVKFALEITASFGRAQDLDVFRTFARHPEFALYASDGILSLSTDPVSDLMRLAKDAEGWGNVDLLDRLLESPGPEVQTFLIRDGLRDLTSLEGYVALRIATTCRLHEVLSEPVDPGLLRGASKVLESLAIDAVEGGPDGDMRHYPEGVVAVERLLGQLRDVASTREDFLAVAWIHRFVTHRRAESEEARTSGWDEDSRVRMAASCLQITGRPEWVDRTHEALDSEDPAVRWHGIAMAEHLRIPLHDYLVGRLRTNPLDDRMWFKFVWGADEQRMDEALSLAEEILDVGTIATGPARGSWMSQEHRRHSCVGFLLQELRRFPGKGWTVLRAGLRSPVTHNRTHALMALRTWSGGQITDDVVAEVDATLADPDPRVRKEAEALRKTLAGPE